MTAADFLLDYVGKHGWYSVTNIFYDNEYSTQPHTINGYICASPSRECIFTHNSIDTENTPIIERNYVTAPYGHIDTEQTITVIPFDFVQRFDCLLFAQGHHYTSRGLATDYPIPTVPSPEEIEAIQLDPETKLASGYPIVVKTDRRYSDKARNNEDPKYATEISVVDLHPDHPEWSNDKFMGLRIEDVQNFIANQKLFASRCNAMFGIDDCV